MSRLVIRNWDKWQTYRKDRNAPPWIKVHRVLLTNAEWAQLSDAEKGQLVSLWLVASTMDGEIPDDAKMLRKLCLLDKEPDIEKLKQLGFLTTNGCQSDANLTPEGRQDDTPDIDIENRGDNRGEKDRYGTFDNVLLTEEEFSKLQERFPTSCSDRIDNLSEYLRSKGKRYKDHYATILTWARKDRRDGKEESGYKLPDWAAGLK